MCIPYTLCVAVSHCSCHVTFDQFNWQTGIMLPFLLHYSLTSCLAVSRGLGKFWEITEGKLQTQLETCTCHLIFSCSWNRLVPDKSSDKPVIENFVWFQSLIHCEIHILLLVDYTGWEICSLTSWWSLIVNDSNNNNVMSNCVCSLHIELASVLTVASNKPD